MQLLIDDLPCDFIPLKTFRQQYGLPPEFGIALFEPKDFSGLAVLDAAGAEMNALRQVVLDAIPARLTTAALLPCCDRLRDLFAATLTRINPVIGLKPEELGFAVAGFDDMTRTLAYALLRARAARQPLPAFAAVYADWLHQSVRVSARQHEYVHEGQRWQVQMIQHVYGRVGLKIVIDSATLYVADARVACPAEGFMQGLLAEVGDRLRQRLD
jgi:hypothetical protein